VGGLRRTQWLSAPSLLRAVSFMKDGKGRVSCDALYDTVAPAARPAGSTRGAIAGLAHVPAIVAIKGDEFLTNISVLPRRW
jgi:hypothetical protein